MILSETILRDAYPQKGTKIGPEDVECIKFVEWLKAQTKSGKLRAVWFHVANEGKRSYRMGSLQRAKGLIAGVPDYVLLYDTGSLCIEFKAGKNKQSKSQKEFERWCDHEGVPYLVVYSAAEAIAVLEQETILWGRED
jgi:hypothetical protein